MLNIFPGDIQIGDTDIISPKSTRLYPTNSHLQDPQDTLLLEVALAGDHCDTQDEACVGSGLS